MDGLKNYIQKNTGILNENQMRGPGGLEVEIQENLPDSIDLNEVLEALTRILPQHLLDNINSIKIGKFEKLEEKGADAVLDSENNILLTNDQEDGVDLLEDIIHEVGHIAEQKFAEVLYKDDKLKKEFKNKRETLYRRLNVKDYDVSEDEFRNLSYTKEFDKKLWQDIGYDVVSQLSHDIFHNAYCATSLREYWSCAFEEYLAGNPDLVKKYYPAAHNKIQEVLDYDELR